MPEEAHLMETAEDLDDSDQGSRCQCPGARLAGIAVGDFVALVTENELAKIICADAVVRGDLVNLELG